MFNFEIDLGDTSDYDDETLANANKAFFLCEEDQDYEAAKPYLLAAVVKRYSYCMVSYAFYLLHEQKTNAKEKLFACDLLLQAAIRSNEAACEFIEEYLTQESREKINSLLHLVKTENLNQWIRGKVFADKEDESTIQKAVKIVYKFICKKVRKGLL